VPPKSRRGSWPRLPTSGVAGPADRGPHPVRIEEPGQQRVLAQPPHEGDLCRIQRCQGRTVGEARTQPQLNLGRQVLTGDLHDARDLAGRLWVGLALPSCSSPASRSPVSAQDAISG
jgi:hypothetical protein